MKTILLVAIFSLSFFSAHGFGAESGDKSRPDAQIREAVSAFHVHLEPVWHRAYPAKDAAAVRAEVPALKHEAEAILRATKAADSWESQVAAEELVKTVDALSAASAANDDDGLFAAVEGMHDSFHTLTSTLNVWKQEQH